MIASTSAEAGNEARRIIEGLVRNPEEGETYLGEVKEIVKVWGIY